MKLFPIAEKLEDNREFTNNPLCQESIYMTIDFYQKVGFSPPWISYYAELNSQLVGCGAFKGAPVNNRIEIAYGTFGTFRQKGIGTEICKQLVELAHRSDPLVIITARTLPEKNFSTRILEKNKFVLIGSVIDPEDGEVWEWEYIII